MSNAATKKITLATVKAFIRKNINNLYVITNSRFDGMEDGVRQCEGATFVKVNPADYKPQNQDTQGIQGVWFVRGSRDYFESFTQQTPEGTITGYKVVNCCGSWKIGVKL